MGANLMFDDVIYILRILCWQDDWMPYDFCFVLHRSKENKLLAYIDAEGRNLADRLWHLVNLVGDVKVGHLYDEDYKGGVVAYDKDLAKKDFSFLRWVWKIAGYMRTEREIILTLFDSKDTEDVSAGKRVRIEGKGIPSRGLEIEKALLLAGAVYGLYKDRQLHVFKDGKWRSVDYVFVANIIRAIEDDRKNLIIKAEGAGTEFKLYLPKSWFKVKKAPFLIKDYFGTEYGLDDIARLYFIRKYHVWVVDFATGTYSYVGDG